jgi:tellurite resistance protein
MELILGILVFFFFGWIVKAVFGSLRVVGNTVLGKGSLKDNFELEFQGLGGLRTQLNEVKNPNEPFTLEVQVRGLFPVQYATNVGFIISVFTKNASGDLEPVFSMINEFQEAQTRAFQDLTGCGEVTESQGFINWVKIGVIPTEILQPAESGRQELSIVIRLVDIDNMPTISLGFTDPDSDNQPLWSVIEHFDFDCEVTGYSEEAEVRDKAQALSIKIGMAVAMADGTLDDSEGIVLKNWIKSILSTHSGDKEKSLKKIYNDAMRESYDLAKSGNLVLDDVCEELNELGDTAQKYQAIELAHKVMAADGKADKREMKVINKVAESLGVDSVDLEKIRDKQIVKLNTSPEDMDILTLLGISSSLSNEEISNQLKKEFIKWNGRLNSLGEGKEKDNAQQMLDLIGKAREKYNK